MILAISSTQQQALLLVFVLVMVEIIFSGYTLPVETMPRFLQITSNLFPIKHWLLVLRSILLKVAGPSVFWPQLMALAALGSAIMTTTILLLRHRRLD